MSNLALVDAFPLAPFVAPVARAPPLRSNRLDLATDGQKG